MRLTNPDDQNYVKRYLKKLFLNNTINKHKGDEKIENNYKNIIYFINNDICIHRKLLFYVPLPTLKTISKR